MKHCYKFRKYSLTIASLIISFNQGGDFIEIKKKFFVGRSDSS